MSVKLSGFKRISSSLRPDWFRRPDMLQVAALCHRPAGESHEILLVTSLGRGHWLLPKGWPKKAISSAETALEEAFEEAGICGQVLNTPIGDYHYQKMTAKGLPLNCVAMIYEVVFTGMATDFPEKGERRVKWFSPKAAAEAVESAELAQILRDFQPTV